MSERTWGDLPIPNIYKELKGEFVTFNEEEEYLECKYPIQEKYFNPMNTTLGGIIDSFMDCTMGPLSFLLGEMVVTKTFTAYNEEVQSKIYNVKPGLTGIGSIIFRDEESIISAITDEDPHEFYKRVIAPYKGELEMWYQSNNSFFLDLQLIFMTAWVILVPTSKLYERWFNDLPQRSF